MIKGIIFDLDGVIVSTDAYHYRAWKSIADEEGIYFDEIINNRLRGVSRLQSLDYILEKASRRYTDSEKLALADKKNEIYVKSLKTLKQSDMLPTVFDTLKTLKQKGIKLAIGSSSKNTKIILDYLKITDMFDVIVDGNQITHSKPNPEVFTKAREALKLPCNEVLVVEDAEAGIDAANAAKIQSCGINGADKYDKCKFKLHKLEDLLTLVNDETVIELNHINKVYPNGFEAVHDFSLKIENNEFVVFVGPSGCGKSTMLRMIAGLEEITDGEFLLNGEYLNETDPKYRNIAMVFQNYALYPHLTVYKNIAFPLSNEPIPFKHYFSWKYRKKRKEEIKQKVLSAADIIGLSDKLDSYPRNLSGGQRQRVALGRAIVRNPKVFLLDEPLSNLDAKMRGQMRSEITALHKKLDVTFIYVTHDQVEAMTMGDKIVVMKDGYIQQVDNPDDLFFHPVNKFVAGFIGTPPMNFINAKIDKNKDLCFNGLTLKTSTKYKKKIDDIYKNKEVILGIRPKSICLPGNQDYVDQGIKINVDNCEHLGEDCLVYGIFNKSNERIIISTSILNRPDVKSEVSISFIEDLIYLFDKDTEKALY